MLKIIRVTPRQFDEVCAHINGAIKWYREIPCRNILLPMQNILLVVDEDAACHVYPPAADITISDLVRQVH